MIGRPAPMASVPSMRHGGPEALVWRDDLPVPRPGPDEVLVRVLAAGVDGTGTSTRKGWQGGEGRATGWAREIGFVGPQGSDLCGRVVALGSGICAQENAGGTLDLGARVIFCTHPAALVSIGAASDPAFAQYCVIKARHLRDISASPLSKIEIGAMPCAYGTAHNLLSRANVAVGERVLVTGASGGVGLAAVQLALLRGAEVTARCSLSNAAALRAMGAAVVSRDARPRDAAFDVVVDVVGGAVWQDWLEALVPGGRYATSGAVAGPMVKGDLRRIYLSDLTLSGAPHQPREVFAGLVSIINTARIRPVVSQVYPLRDSHPAQADMQAGRCSGKLVLVPSETLS